MNTVQPIKENKDIEKIIKHLYGRNLLLFIFGVNSSLRISDILSLSVGDVRNQTSVTIKETKTKKTKTFKLNQGIIDAINEFVPSDAKDSDWLFPSKRNPDKPLDRTQAWRILKDASESAKLNINFGTHTLRKTWAYHRYKNGTDLAKLMKALNHSSQKETLRYIGIEQEEMDDLYDSHVISHRIK